MSSPQIWHIFEDRLANVEAMVTAYLIHPVASIDVELSFASLVSTAAP